MPKRQLAERWQGDRRPAQLRRLTRHSPVHVEKAASEPESRLFSVRSNRLPKKKAAPKGRLILLLRMLLALTGFEAALRLVDDVDAALTAHDTAIAVTLLERAERVLDFHRISPCRGARAPVSSWPQKDR